MADTAVSVAPFALPEEPTEPDLLAKYFKVLSDPTRVRILSLLQERGELSVGGLVRGLGQSQPKISNHLACLRWCGFVHARREHPSVLYSVADDRVLEVLGARPRPAGRQRRARRGVPADGREDLMMAGGRRGPGPRFSATAVLLACCASHVLALGTVGALVAGSGFGLVASLVVAAVVLAGFFVVRHRRPACRSRASGWSEVRAHDR